MDEIHLLLIQLLLAIIMNEMKTYNSQKDQWRLYNDHADNPYLQKDCLCELHQLTITLANMYDALPQLTGLSFLHDYNGENSFEFLEADSRKEPSSLSSESRSFPGCSEPVV